MKGIIFTKDGLSYEVLTRSLREDGFEGFELKSPDAANFRDFPSDDLDLLMFIDLDFVDASDVRLFMPADASVVFFGAHARKSSLPSTLKPCFMAKPLDRAGTKRAVKAALLGEIAIEKKTPGNPAGDDAALIEAWKKVLTNALRRRAELRKLLTATPEQLRTLLTKRIVVGPDGKPRVPLAELPLQTALVVESDPSIAKVITRYLARRNVIQADIAEDGAAAWQRLSTTRYDAIVLAWETEAPTGLALYNRLRLAAATKFTPILVTSATLQKPDFRLLEEDFAVQLVAKPVQEQVFAPALSQVVTNAAIGKEQLRAVAELGEASVLAGFFNTPGRFPRSKEIDEIVLCALRVVGEKFLAAGNHAAAESAFGQAWQLGDRRMSLVTGYAKACFFAGKPAKARKLLAKANAIAPKSIERLCLLGEVDLVLRKPEEARSRFQEALTIDQGSPTARAGIAVVDGITKDPPVDQKSNVVGTFAAYLNLAGINLARGGRITEALNYYRSAMSFVHSDEDLAKLWFNFGVCHLRGKNPDEATEAFGQAVKVSGGKLTKAAKYLQGSKQEKPVVSCVDDDEDIEFERFSPHG